VLQYPFNCKTLSAMAGVTWWNFYFRRFPGAMRSPPVVEFLRYLRGRRLSVWDGLRAHRSRLLWDFQIQHNIIGERVLGLPKG
jgi:hypothetical protein